MTKKEIEILNTAMAALQVAEDRLAIVKEAFQDLYLGDKEILQ